MAPRQLGTLEDIFQPKITPFALSRFVNIFVYWNLQHVCLFDLILYIQSTIFQLNRDGSSWVEPVLYYYKCVLHKDHNAVTPVRLQPNLQHG